MNFAKARRNRQEPAGKREEAEVWMKTNQVDILTLRETRTKRESAEKRVVTWVLEKEDERHAITPTSD